MGKADDDDFGFRTPTRKQKKVPESDAPKKRDTGRRKRETGKHRRDAEKAKASAPKKRDTGKHKRQRDAEKDSAPKKRDTGKHKREREELPKKRDTGKHRAADTAPPPPRPKGSPVPMIAGLGAALVLGGLIAALMVSSDPPQQASLIERKQPETFAITPEQSARPIKPAPAPIPAPLEPLTDDLVEETVEPAPTEEPKGDALEELAKKSSTHAALARLLEEYAALFDPKALHNPGPLLESFRERQQKEQELLERLRAMGPGAVAALKDMLLGLDNRQYRIFLGKGLAGIEGPDALAAVSAILGEVKDVALQTTLVRFLPANPDSARTIGEAIAHEENGNLRCMLLREYHRRLAPGDESGRDIFREAALNDADSNVRAEAVTIIGRRGDPRDQTLMEQIIADEQNLSIRQRAIVSYAETGKENSLPFLENLIRMPNTALAVHASAVLAIGRVGGDQAIQTLDLIAQTHQSQEIRVRAERLVQSLRRRQAQAASGDAGKSPIRTPMRIGGGGAEGGRPPAVPVRRQ